MGAITIKQAITILKENLDENDSRPTIPLGHDDLSPFPSFRTANVVEDAIIDALCSAKYNCYAPNFGIPPAKRYATALQVFGAKFEVCRADFE
ncbi:hypothetical protein Pint_02311 [Pistacia integerrima]|uniref:Uncharacterized protein n=1 Tax=Pistacia integerrima TaxID=434235 RepID=A0ACC0ZGS9_9ROSI|nr:hypothetical protein Pint_02311 [Pistacia integerrima]